MVPPPRSLAAAVFFAPEKIRHELQMGTDGESACGGSPKGASR